MPLVIVNGVKIYYEMDGAGTPFVMLHPDTLDLSVWDRQTPFFSRSFRVIRYDARGHGRSESPKSWYTRATHVEDLAQLLRYLEINECYLMGLSGGGSRAISFTLTHPYMVKALILVDSYVTGHKMSSSLLRYADMAKTEGVKKALSEWLKIGSVSHVKPELKDAVQELVLAHEGAPLLDPLFGRYREATDLERLGNIYTPTLVVYGEDDLEDFIGMAKAIHSRIRDSTLIEVKGAGHVPNMEQEDTFNQTVLDFLRRVQSARRARRS
jgi:pimeloyl-ACP methyl ester carboxylesterase